MILLFLFSGFILGIILHLIFDEWYKLGVGCFLDGLGVVLMLVCGLLLIPGGLLKSCILVDKGICDRTAEKMNMHSKYDMISGCLVNDGTHDTWIDLDNYIGIQK